jgi:hypothetical protein
LLYQFLDGAKNYLLRTVLGDFQPDTRNNEHLEHGGVPVSWLHHPNSNRIGLQVLARGPEIRVNWRWTCNPLQDACGAAVFVTNSPIAPGSIKNGSYGTLDSVP